MSHCAGTSQDNLAIVNDIYFGSILQIDVYNMYRVSQDPNHTNPMMFHTSQQLPYDLKIYIVFEIQKVSLVEVMVRETPGVMVCICL
jgi:hypothetical protein